MISENTTDPLWELSSTSVRTVPHNHPLIGNSENRKTNDATSAPAWQYRTFA